VIVYTLGRSKKIIEIQNYKRFTQFLKIIYKLISCPPYDIPGNLWNYVELFLNYRLFGLRSHVESYTNNKKAYYCSLVARNFPLRANYPSQLSNPAKQQLMLL